MIIGGLLLKQSGFRKKKLPYFSGVQGVACLLRSFHPKFLLTTTYQGLELYVPASQ